MVDLDVADAVVEEAHDPPTLAQPDNVIDNGGNIGTGNRVGTDGLSSLFK